MKSVEKVVAWLRAVKPVRVYKLYSSRGGNLSAAGMGFQSLFATFAAVWVGFSIAAIVIQGDQARLQAVINFINTQVPGLITTGGLIDPNQLMTATALGFSSALSLIILSYTALNWLEYTRVAFRRTFGLPVLMSSFFLRKVRDVILALAYGAVILVSSLLSFLSTGFLTWILGLLGVNDTTFVKVVIRIATGLFVLGLDMVILASMIRMLSGVKIPRKPLWLGSLYGAIAVGLLKIGGGFLMGSASRNPLLASFAVLIVLLLWFNLIARAYLLSVAWIAVSLEDRGESPVDAKSVRNTRKVVA